MNKPGDKYRPSSGTEGEVFEAKHCNKCRHYEYVEEFGFSDCMKSILGDATGFDIDYLEYPDAWTFTAEGAPTCTEFQSHPTMAEIAEQSHERRQDRIRAERIRLEEQGQLKLL